MPLEQYDKDGLITREWWNRTNSQLPVYRNFRRDTDQARVQRALHHARIARAYQERAGRDPLYKLVAAEQRVGPDSWRSYHSGTVDQSVGVNALKTRTV